MRNDPDITDKITALSERTNFEKRKFSAKSAEVNNGADEMKSEQARRLFLVANPVCP